MVNFIGLGHGDPLGDPVQHGVGRLGQLGDSGDAVPLARLVIGARRGWDIALELHDRSIRVKTSDPQFQIGKRGQGELAGIVAFPLQRCGRIEQLEQSLPIGLEEGMFAAG